MHRLELAELPSATRGEADLTEDWLVDGTPLHHLVARASGSEPFQLCSSVDPRWISQVALSVLDRLAVSGRHPLYVCRLCADETCGFVAVRIAVDEATVTWSDFARVSDDVSADQPDDHVVAMERAHDPIEGLGPYVFDGAAYDALLARERVRWSAVPPGEPLAPFTPDPLPTRRWWRRT